MAFQVASGSYGLRSSGGSYFPNAASGFSGLIWAKLLTDRDASSAIFGMKDSGSGYFYLYNANSDGTTFSFEDSNGMQLVGPSMVIGTWYCFAWRISTTADLWWRTPATPWSSSSGACFIDFNPQEIDLGVNGYNHVGGWFPGVVAGLKEWGYTLSVNQLLAEAEQHVPYTAPSSWYPMMDAAPDGGVVVDYGGLARHIPVIGGFALVDGPPIPWRATGSVSA